MVRLRLFAFAAALFGAGTAYAAAPPPSSITPDLVAAATKEGTVVFYTSIELQTAEKVGEAFEKAYPGIKVQVERNGAERIFQRLSQERGANIHAADVVEASDMTALLSWKQEGWLAPFVPADVAKSWPADQKDPDGCYATERFTLSPILYNTKLVKAADAPKSFADLLDPKWAGKIVKAHPGYSGTIMTVTFEMARDIGWDFFKKLGQQYIMQVQSAADPPKKVAQGERPVAADGGEYVPLQMISQGAPLALVYPTEGTPSIPGGAAVMIDAPHPNAARLFDLYLFSKEGQTLLVKLARLRSFHPDAPVPEGAKPLSEIKIMKADPAAQQKQIEDIKKKYAEYFGL
ncbi:MAG TPA: extracellular solute-binding protein [Stellaceae bacterium]|jgi:iron(III) transport system substrate-binding protein|nr:extracellular solute-binding protein [Stellaceae bacterium]